MKVLKGGLRNLRIRYKTALILNVFSAVIIVIVSIVHAVQFKSALEQRILLQLSSIRHLKTVQINNLLNKHMHEIEKMLIHIDDEAYLDALAADEFVHIDSIVLLSNQILPQVYKRDSIHVKDISQHVNDGDIHLSYEVIHDSLVYVFYSTPRDIQMILFERTGMGATGETYIVGEDSCLRTVSRFYPDTLPTAVLSNTLAVRAAYKTGAGALLYADYRNEEVFSSFAPFTHQGLHWVILSEIDKNEALKPIHDMQIQMYGVATLLFIIVFLLSYGLAKFIVKPIINVKTVLNQIASGEEVRKVNWKSDDEIGSLFNALHALVEVSDSIINFANQIASGASTHLMPMRGPHDKLVIALNHMNDQLSELKLRERTLLLKNQRQLMLGEEQERTRLSRELHDSIGPLLTNLKISLSQSSIAQEEKTKLALKISRIIDEVRKISTNLMPSVLQDFGLAAAIENYLKLEFSNSPIKVTFRPSKEGESTTPHEVALNLFRILQEAVHNAMKYSKASEIKISVTEFRNQVNLFITDNGVGFDLENINHGNGLLNMQERVKMFDGHCEINSNKTGTTIEVEISM